MPYHFQFRRYRLPLRTPLRTAREVWTERQGLLLRLEDEQQRVAWAEVAPIPAFGTETVDAAEEACRSIGEWPVDEQLGAVPASFGCVRAALSMARRERPNEATAPEPAYWPMAALLPTGRPALAQIRSKAELGFRVFKWKVGVAPVADELPLLDDLCALLPEGSKLRLDANGAWARRDAERWLERCAERPVEFVEQPCFAPATEGKSAVRRAEDLVLGLANDFPTPIALDESLIGANDVERWIAAGWPGWYVVKPSLLGDIDTALAGLARARANVVFSSALETGVGAQAALRVAWSWAGERKALGFGVWPLFADARFDGPAALPFLRREDIDRLNPEAAWNALN